MDSHAEYDFQEPVRNMDELKQGLIEAWSEIQLSVIGQATEIKDKHFEHLMCCGIIVNLSRLFNSS